MRLKPERDFLVFPKFAISNERGNLYRYAAVLTAAHCVENDRRYVAHINRHSLGADDGETSAGAEVGPLHKLHPVATHPA